MRALLVALLAAFLLSGCVTLTEQGAVLGGTVLIRPVVDTRVPSPAVVEALEEIEAETGEACIDLNVADIETLQLITNIGPYRAQYITDLRNLFTFTSADDLLIVPGIGERRLQQIREQGIVCELGG